jgi:hypothetical protein
MGIRDHLSHQEMNDRQIISIVHLSFPIQSRQFWLLMPSETASWMFQNYFCLHQLATQDFGFQQYLWEIRVTPFHGT